MISSSLRLALITIVLLSFFPVFLLTLQTGLEHRQMAVDAVKMRAVDLARHAAHDEADLIDGAYQLLQGLATMPQPLLRGAACQRVLANLVNRNPSYAVLAVAGTDGTLLCSSPSYLGPLTFSDRSWFQQAIQSRDFAVGEYEIDRISGKADVGLGYPAFDVAGEVESVLFLGLDLSELGHLPSEIQLPPGSILTVRDRNGTILRRYPDGDQWLGKNVPQSPLMAEILRRQGASAELEDTDGITRLYAAAPLSDALGAGAYVSVGIPASIAYDDANLILIRNLVLLAVITVVALTAARWGADSLILRPVDALLSATRRLAAGDPQARTGLPYGLGQLNQLAHSFDGMAEVLQQRQAEAREAQDQLKYSEEHFRSLIENVLDLIAVLDAQGMIRYASPSAERVLGYKPEELIGTNAFDLFHSDDIPRTASLFANIVQNVGTTESAELRARRKDGRWVFIEGIGKSLADGRAGVFVVVTVRDITERKQANEALRGSKEFIETVFDSVNDGICVIDATDFKIIRANRAFLSVYDEKESNIIGRKCYEVTHHLSKPCEPPSDRCPLAETLETGSVSTAEHVHYDKHGQKVYVEVSTSPLRDKNGTIRQIVHKTHDVTERKRNEEEVQRHLQRLSALRSIEMLVTSSLDIGVTLNVLVEQVITQLGIDAADVLLYNPDTQRLEYAAGRGFRTDALQHTRLRLGEGHAGKAALERRIRNVLDLLDDPGELSLAPLLAGELFVAYCAAPLIAKGQIKGVLEVFRRSRLDPDPEWLGFVELLAGQAAIAIDNATLFEDAHRSNLELSVAYDATLEGWVRALDLRHKETEGHTQRVTEKVLILGRALGLNDAELADLRRGALLHDIGKLGIPDSILLKPGPLSEEEWTIMRRHPVYAHQFLSPIEFLRRALEIPYCHHERWDGAGYPRGLRGEEIPLGARIFAVVDVWDALRSDRPYRSSWPEEKVRDHIRNSAGTHFDPSVVEAFLNMLESGTALLASARA